MSLGHQGPRRRDIRTRGKIGAPQKRPFLPPPIPSPMCSGCRKRRSAKEIRWVFFVFGTLSVTFRSLFLMLLSLFSSPLSSTLWERSRVSKFYRLSWILTRLENKALFQKTPFSGCRKRSVAKGVRSLFSFAGRFRSLFGHVFWRFCHFPWKP